jgi:hypothetical protein
MLLTKNFLVKINQGNLGFYRNLLNNSDLKINNIINLPIDYISKHSKFRVDVKCDICDKINNVSYLSYNNSLNYGFYSCNKCKTVKTKATNLKKYGVETFNNIDKRKNTMNNLYGYYYNNRYASKQTCIEKYGFDNVSYLNNVKDKKKNTIFNNYGVDNPTYIKDGKFIYEQDGYINYDKINKIHTIVCDDHTFEINTNLFYSRYYSNTTICTICNPIGENRQKSIKEKNLYEFIKLHYDKQIIQGYRDQFEIDIYLPELNLGFEFNGLYWHSEIYKDKNYHLDKTKFFKNKGINIIHIWEDDWDYKVDIIKSFILNKISKTSNKIYARKCEIKIVNTKEYKAFINKNHLQGYVNSIIKLGLYYKNDLVSIMTFDTFEGRKKMEIGGWNLSRFCTVLNTNVIGGASKLLKYFIKNYNPSRIISYADISWSNGNLYDNLKFQNIGESKPDYKYIVNEKRINKSRFRKDKLNLEDKTKVTESQIMIDKNIYKIYDCGKIKFELILIHNSYILR